MRATAPALAVAVARMAGSYSGVCRYSVSA